MRLRSTRFGLVAGLVTAGAFASDNIHNACSALSDRLGDDRVAYPNSTAYDDGMSYWSARQSAQRPACLVTPATAGEVSLVLTTLIRSDAPFTFRSGGHTAHANGSNTDDGVTVDLARLDAVRLADDGASVSVGAGLRWGDVSRALDPLGLAVLGGRDADVGVAGLLLGGGFSFFSGRHGWACDNVLGMEVALASGDVVYASQDRHRDLFWALKGGGGSGFGVVTRFDLATIRQGDLWARTVIFAGQAKEAIAEAATTLITRGMDEDPDAHAYFVRTHQPAYGGFINLASFYHATPPPPPLALTPPVFRPFNAIPGALSNTTMVANLTAVSESISTPYGMRQTWSNVAFAAGSPAVIAELLALWEEAVERVVPQAAARGATYSPFAIYQAITTGQLRASQRRGGNAMGLSPETGPMVMMHFLTGWDDESLDEAVLQSTRELVRAADDKTRALGAHRSFIYMNYGGQRQNVLQSYGPENYLRLLQTSLRYDPRRDLQRLWKGYFKFY
ncbi:FAD binding domain-containing protein [Cordyceps javanica]|uniref:FAD binding domain-containing protein n=1 Tax=Cordyceps javanica TaxID=43265 RepID=A0A545VUX4_9HYPO|nr:FAD binding domain-containing protein [Cordyceps javanica]TQW05498.1 FAD binding domain protein [Cordyceps javanica]